MHGGYFTYVPQHLIKQTKMTQLSSPAYFITSFFALPMQIRHQTHQQQTLHAVPVLLFPYDPKPDVRHAEMRCKHMVVQGHVQPGADELWATVALLV